MVSVGIMGYNEEANIESAVNTVMSALKRSKVRDYEIIAVDDGSIDRTGEILRRIATKNKRLRVISDGINRGIGWAFKEIIRQAKGEKVCFVAGDDIVTERTICQLFENMHRADVVMTYYVNKEERNTFRIFLSNIYNLINTFAFDTHVNYINGAGIYTTKMVQALNIRANRYFVAAEMNLKILRQGATFYEAPAYAKPNATKSSALKFRNLIDVIYCFIRTYWEIKVSQRKIFNKPPVRIIDT